MIAKANAVCFAIHKMASHSDAALCEDTETLRRCRRRPRPRAEREGLGSVFDFAFSLFNTSNYSPGRLGMLMETILHKEGLHFWLSLFESAHKVGPHHPLPRS